MYLHLVSYKYDVDDVVFFCFKYFFIKIKYIN